MTRARQNSPERAQSGEISASEAAERLGITTNAVGQWTARPNAPARKVGNRVWVQWPAFARWREQQMIETAKRESAPAVSLEEARTRKALAEAELAELDVAKARGEYVAVADAGAAWGRALDLVVARLRTLGPALAEFGPEVEAAAEAEAERIVQELHDTAADVVDESADAAKEAA